MVYYQIPSILLWSNQNNNYLLQMRHTRENQHESINGKSRRQLWKKIGKDSKDQIEEPQPEMMTSLDLEISKVKQNLVKSRTLITKDYFKDVSMAESGFIDIQAQEVTTSPTETPAEFRYPRLNFPTSLKLQLSQKKLMSLSMAIQQLRYKYQKFQISFSKKLQVLFENLCEIVISKFCPSTINNLCRSQLQELVNHNKQLQMQKQYLVKVVEQKIDRIETLEKELECFKQANKANSRGNYKARESQHGFRESRFIKGDLFQEQDQIRKRSHRSQRQKGDSFSEVSIPGSHRQKYRHDYKDIKRKLQSLKSQIQRIS